MTLPFLLVFCQEFFCHMHSHGSVCHSSYNLTEVFCSYIAYGINARDVCLCGFICNDIAVFKVNLSC